MRFTDLYFTLHFFLLCFQTASDSQLFVGNEPVVFFDSSILVSDVHVNMDAYKISKILSVIQEIAVETHYPVEVEATSINSSPDGVIAIVEFSTYITNSEMTKHSWNTTEIFSILTEVENHLSKAFNHGVFASKLLAIPEFDGVTIENDAFEIVSLPKVGELSSAMAMFTDDSTNLGIGNSTDGSISEPLCFLLLGDVGDDGIHDGYDHNAALSVFHDDDLKTMAPITHNAAILPGNSYAYQAAVGRVMAAFAIENNPTPSFVVALGDNSYDNSGVQSSSAASLETSLWTDVYMTYSSLNIPWYAVLGNHDYGYGQQGVQAQIDRTWLDTDGASTWVMPATNYTRRFDIPSGGYVQIVFIDTTTLAPSENRGVSSETMSARIKNQVAHISAMLQAAREADPQPEWLLVAGHYPVYSFGEHGDTDELIKYLLPLLLEFKVDAYLCGHDHISEHLFKDGVHYFVAGGGSMTGSLSASSSAELLWSGTGYSAFAAVTLDASSLTVSYRNILGMEEYSYEIVKGLGDLSNTSQPTDASVWVLCKGLVMLITFSLMVVVIMLSWNGLEAQAQLYEQHRRRRLFEASTLSDTERGLSGMRVLRAPLHSSREVSVETRIQPAAITL